MTIVNFAKTMGGGVKPLIKMMLFLTLLKSDFLNAQIDYHFECGTVQSPAFSQTQNPTFTCEPSCTDARYQLWPHQSGVIDQHHQSFWLTSPPINGIETSAIRTVRVSFHIFTDENHQNTSKNDDELSDDEARRNIAPSVSWGKGWINELVNEMNAIHANQNSLPYPNYTGYNSVQAWVNQFGGDTRIRFRIADVPSKNPLFPNGVESYDVQNLDHPSAGLGALMNKVRFDHGSKYDSTLMIFLSSGGIGVAKYPDAVLHNGDSNKSYYFNSSETNFTYTPVVKVVGGYKTEATVTMDMSSGGIIGLDKNDPNFTAAYHYFQANQQLQYSSDFKLLGFVDGNGNAVNGSISAVADVWSDYPNLLHAQNQSVTFEFKGIKIYDAGAGYSNTIPIYAKIQMGTQFYNIKVRVSTHSIRRINYVSEGAGYSIRPQVKFLDPSGKFLPKDIAFGEASAYTTSVNYTGVATNIGSPINNTFCQDPNYAFLLRDMHIEQKVNHFMRYIKSVTAVHEAGHNFGLNHTGEKPPLVSCSEAYVNGDDFLTDLYGNTHNNCLPNNWNGCETNGHNNVMGYSNCTYISPQQRGRMLRNMSLGKGSKLIIASEPMPNEELVVQSNQTWDHNLRVYTHIRVKTGVTLTISGTLVMPPQGRIYVERGAKLILDHATITTYDKDVWAGIQVWGDMNLPQTAANQGTVIVKDCSLIEHAQTAISTSRYDENKIWYDHSGGIVQAQNSTFRNNKRDFEFMSYNMKVANISFIKNCILTSSDQLKFVNTNYSINHITAWEVRGISIENNRFDNEITSNFTKKVNLIGIYTIDCFNLRIKNNQFLKQSNGISHLMDRLFSTNHVMFNNNFDDTDFGIQLESSRGDYVSTNTFHFTRIIGDIYKAAVIVRNSNGVTITRNNINGSVNLHNMGYVLLGIYVLNDPNIQTTPVEVRENIIREMTYGYLQWGTDPFAFVVCNDFHYNITDFGYISNFANPVLHVVGDVDAQNNYSSAGNRYFNRTPITGPSLPYKGHLWGNDITYYLTNPSDNQPPLFNSTWVTGPIYNFPWYKNKCQEINLQQKIKALPKLEAELKNISPILDAGNNKAILSMIYDDLEENTLYQNYLLPHSPYLSNDILVALFTQKRTPLSEALQFAVMQKNAPFTPYVLEKISPFLATKVQDSLVNYQVGVSVRWILEAKRNLLLAKYQLYKEAILQSYALDNKYIDIVLNTNADSLVNQRNLLLKQDIGFAAIESGDSLLSFNQINVLPDTTLNQNSRKQHQQKVFHWNHSKRNSFELDSLDLTWSMDAATQNLYSTDKSRNRLAFYHQIDNPIPFPIEILSQNFKKSPEIDQNCDIVIKPQLLVFPNPVENELTIHLNQDNIETVSIYNQMGTKVWENNIENSITLDIHTWTKGVYIIRNARGQFIKFLKL